MNNNQIDTTNCDKCENCDKYFNQYKDVIRNDEVNYIWDYHVETDNDDGDLCADCILKLDYTINKCVECNEYYDTNSERISDLDIRDLWLHLQQDNSDVCIDCVYKLLQ